MLDKFYSVLASWKAVPVGILLDALFTTISYFIVGDWSFEANPFLPDLWWVVVLANIYYLVWCINPGFRYLANGMRLMAVVGHSVLWIQIAVTGDVSFTRPAPNLVVVLLVTGLLPVAFVSLCWLYKRYLIGR